MVGYNGKVTSDISIEKIIDEDKSPKESCVENIMHDIDELGNGKQVKSLRGAIEQQIRRAWNGGYCNGLREGSDHQAEACCDISWFMMQTVAEYNADELQVAFGYDHLADVIEHLTYNEFYDMYEDYEDRKREEAKKIRVGDEIRWTQSHNVYGGPIYKRHAGIVLSVEPDTYVVLAYNETYVGFYKRRLLKDNKTIEKAYVHFDIDSVEKRDNGTTL